VETGSAPRPLRDCFSRATNFLLAAPIVPFALLRPFVVPFLPVPFTDRSAAGGASRMRPWSGRSLNGRYRRSARCFSTRGVTIRQKAVILSFLVALASTIFKCATGRSYRGLSDAFVARSSPAAELLHVGVGVSSDGRRLLRRDPWRLKMRARSSRGSGCARASSRSALAHCRSAVECRCAVAGFDRRCSVRWSGVCVSGAREPTSADWRCRVTGLRSLNFSDSQGRIHRAIRK
jgi:hypothetical protein